MCGICGFTQATEKDAPLVKAMCDVMAHRGPDGEGVYLDNGIALGHRRLSLIDLAGGAQPMVRATAEPVSAVTSPAIGTDGCFLQGAQAGRAKGDFAIVFNGEIYNYRDMRATLESEGWAFQTESDTEVLLVGYIAWGEAVLDRLRGMFTFAVWDNRRKELFCARDFFGIKPFYYYEAPTGQFIFASEIKSILEHPAYHRAVNEDVLEHYLCFQFSPLAETFFQDIYKLQPGCCMRVGERGMVETRRYWKPEYAPARDRSKGETVNLIADAMTESVRYHNVADVEVGSFLSSGIDSSYLAALLARENPAIKTFTVGFAEYEGERDEVSWARELAERLEVENEAHHITEEEYWESLPLVQWHMDEPSADPSAVALYFVDKLAATRVKAVLSGEGADEFFGGYRIYQAPLASHRLSWAPKGLLRGASKAARHLGVRGANYLERASEDAQDWYYTNANGVAFTPEEREQLRAGRRPAKQGKPQSPQAVTAEVYAEAAGLDEPTRMQYADLAFWLPGDILLKTDKMAMAHSLESRVPFLDRRVFELAATVPTEQKLDSTQTKIALREAAERVIPPDWAQKEKLGFPVPLAAWLRKPQWVQRLKAAFTGDVAARYFNPAILEQLLNEHLAGTDRSRKLWIIYMFLVWHDVYFGNGLQKTRTKPSDARKAFSEATGI